MRPLRAVAKQRRYAYAVGEAAEVDLWLLNDTGRAAGGRLRLSVTDPAGRSTTVGTHAPPPLVADQFSYLVAERVRLPAFAAPGPHTVVLALAGRPGSARGRGMKT